MRWRVSRSGQTPQAVHRVVLRRAAHRYASHGWDVVPGACLMGDRFQCAQPGCPTLACHPALSDWERAATTDPHHIARWWRREHHGVLLATGRAFDVLELAGTVGGQIVNLVRGPVAVAPPERWMFLVRAGGSLRPELADHPAVVLHQHGSWIPAPPTRLANGRVRWEIAPHHCDWLLPDPYAVQLALVRAIELESSRTPRAGPYAHWAA
jgi:hypothetical protein